MLLSVEVADFYWHPSGQTGHPLRTRPASLSFLCCWQCLLCRSGYRLRHCSWCSENPMVGLLSASVQAPPIVMTSIIGLCYLVSMFHEGYFSCSMVSTRIFLLILCLYLVVYASTLQVLLLPRGGESLLSSPPFSVGVILLTLVIILRLCPGSVVDPYSRCGLWYTFWTFRKTFLLWEEDASRYHFRYWLVMYFMVLPTQDIRLRDCGSGLLFFPFLRMGIILASIQLGYLAYFSA